MKTNNKLVEQEEGDKYSRSTIDQYRTTLDRIKLFLQKEYDCNDIPLSKLDVLFIRRFEIFLKTAYGIDHKHDHETSEATQEGDSFLLCR
ncbi:MAG: phage integrase SAM-like domain-containing protein [Mangrovibacterium sp.]